MLVVSLFNTHMIIMPLIQHLFSCSFLGVIIYLPFSIMPSLTLISSLNVQYNLISCGTSFLLSGQPLMLYAVSSLAVSCCVSCAIMQLGCLLSCALH